MERLQVETRLIISHFQGFKEMASPDLSILQKIDISTETGGPCAEILLIWGITPLAVYQAREMVGGVFSRMINYGILKGDAPLRIISQPQTGNPEYRQNGISQVSLEAEIISSLEISKLSSDYFVLAEPLLELLLLLSERAPYMFEGIVRQPDGTFWYSPNNKILA